MFYWLVNYSPLLVPATLLILFTGYELYYNVTFVHQCPHCKSVEVRRTARRGWQKRVAGIQAYRCRQCAKRFMRLSASAKSATKLRIIRKEIAE
ncbi:hypothetical protein [Spirosoma harenae]